MRRLNWHVWTVSLAASAFKSDLLLIQIRTGFYLTHPFLRESPISGKLRHYVLLDKLLQRPKLDAERDQCGVGYRGVVVHTDLGLE
jgi:hypothetical protein